MARVLKKAEVDEVLKNWNVLAEFLKTAPVEHVNQLLKAEISARKRYHIIKRLYTRSAMLKFAAERDEYMAQFERKR